MTIGSEGAMVQNIAEPYGMGYISEQQPPYPYFRKSMAAIAWFCVFLSKPLTLKGEGARALSPLRWGPR